MFEYIGILIAGLFVLAVAANYLVHSSIHIAKRLKVSEALIGLTIVAAGTSAPEIAVSVKAALGGQGALSVGNVIGSNIFNLGFILGLVAVICPQKITKKMVYRDGLILFLSTLLVLFFVWDQYIGLIEGSILLLCLVAYNVFLWKKRDFEEIDEQDEVKANWKDFVIFPVSLLFLIKSADYVVDAAVGIAESLGMSQWAIGATIIAAGTSLPEIAASVIATMKKKFGLSIGNVVGSDIFNALGIIGVSSVVAPLTLESNKGFFELPDNVISLILLVLTIVIILIMMRTGWRLSRREGFILLAISIGRMAFEISLG